jgi:nitrate/TMAO reductase-like tetraheme cytochrome c subunit
MPAHLVVALQQASTIAADGVDTARVQTPLPGGVGLVVRRMFNAPSWLQISVVAAAGVLFVALLVWVWLRRAALIGWMRTRSRGWKIALAGLSVLILNGAASFSLASWKYTQHSNDFCIACHVMNTAWTRFQHSEHRKLLCHDCHQQSIFASMRQLYLWVAERPSDIPPHAKVPTAVCATCHNQSKPDSTWKRILATAGHRVHMRNDDPKLRDVQCVTCHGAEVHHFVPISKTCAQSGCHENITVKLGKMGGQTSLHCTGCHDFTSPVGVDVAVSPDSARVHLVPTGAKCLDCHAMRKRMSTTLAELEPETEAHGGVCGDCHDPHKQEVTKAAFESCGTASCHARADTLTPYHRGLPNGALERCGSCHSAHKWKVKSTNCVACHREGGKIPVRDLKPGQKRVHGPAVDEEGIPEEIVDDGEELIQSPAIADTTFSHTRHKALTCSACHSVERSHGELTIKRPTGCLECHHGPTQKATCTTCHASAALPDQPQTVRVSMSVGSGPHTRTLPFQHERHARIECKSCHSTPVTLAAATTCASCHAEHHTEASTCQACHPALPPSVQRAAHPRATVHDGCSGSGCHRDAAILAMPPVRNVCVACHRAQANHKPGGDCGSCHLIRWLPTGSDGGAR